MIALLLAAAFASLSVLHLYWACGGRWAHEGAIPSVDGAPAFVAGAGATTAVAAALAAAAVCVLWRGAWVDLGGMAPTWLPRVGTGVLAALFALRAIGEFHTVGLFKTERDGLFAERDTRIYTPLCLAISVLAAWLAGPGGAG